MFEKAKLRVSKTRISLSELAKAARSATQAFFESTGGAWRSFPSAPGGTDRLKKINGRLAWETVVANVARGRGQSGAARLTPNCSVDLLLITDLQTPRHLLRQENRITHPAAGAAALAFTSFHNFNRPSFSLGSSSLISRRRQPLSLSPAHLRAPGNIQSPSRLRLTISTRPFLVTTNFEDFAIGTSAASPAPVASSTCKIALNLGANDRLDDSISSRDLLLERGRRLV